jgi:hypothetical protein
MNKKLGASSEAPTQTATSSDNHHDRYNCQGETEKSLLFTLPNDQIGDVKAPGAIIAGSVRSLPLQIGHSDHKCQQVWRDKTHAVYKHFGSHGQFIGWEAILIKVAPARRIFGKDYPEREVYPGNEDFGRYALSVGAQYDLEYAIQKARTLKVKNSEKQGLKALVSTNVAGRTGKPTGTGRGRTGTGTNTNWNTNWN